VFLKLPFEGKSIAEDLMVLNTTFFQQQM